ncbi:MAG: extracellular solute-binding protein [Spirochaetaceae bacterium]|nr:MAG: extracellular solute-binding protein [Spirochaetaceae bacterium]
MSRIIAVIGVFLVFTLPAFAGGRSEGQSRLRVMIVERSEVPRDQGRVNDNPWTEYVQREMAKLDIDVRFVPVGGSLVRHTVMMATNTAPDLAFTHGRLLFMKFAADGGLHDLGQYIPEYGPNIPAVLGESHLRLGQIDGVQYAIPSRREIDARYASFIRKDWLDALGMDVPTNRAELTAALRAFRDRNPGNVPASELRPWGWFTDDPGTVFDSDFKLFDAMYSFLEHDPAANMGSLWPVRDGFRDFMRWLHDLYQEGLIEREFATDKFEIKTRHVVNGSVGFIHVPWDYLYAQNSSSVALNLARNVPGAEFVPVDVFEGPDGVYRKLRYLPTRLYAFSPRRSRVPEAAVAYLNWMLADDTAWTLAFGRTGDQHTIVDGLPVFGDLQRYADTFGYISESLRILGDFPFGPKITSAVREQFRVNDFSGNDARALAMARENSFQEPVFQSRMSTMARSGPGLIRIAESYWVKLITEPNFDAQFDEFIRRMNDRGMQEIIDERRAYRERFGVE